MTTLSSNSKTESFSITVCDFHEIKRIETRREDIEFLIYVPIDIMTFVGFLYIEMENFSV